LPFCVTCPHRQNHEFVLTGKAKSLIDSFVASFVAARIVQAEMSENPNRSRIAANRCPQAERTAEFSTPKTKKRVHTLTSAAQTDFFIVIVNSLLAESMWRLGRHVGRHQAASSI
jgi:hypothetical protein